MTDYSGFGSSPPATTVNSAQTPLTMGCTFSVTSGGTWFKGYRWWVNASGQDTGPMTFQLWQVNGPSGIAAKVPGTAVTSGPMTPGQWNTVLPGTPVPLAPGDPATVKGAVYTAAGGRSFTTGWPEVKNQFGSGQPFAAGITSGPLALYSSLSGSRPVGSGGSWGKPQQPFALISDPTTGMPTSNDSDAWLGMDVLVTDQAPAGATFRGPSAAPLFVVPGVSAQASAYTVGPHFTLSQPCAPKRIWHYSPPGVTILPSRCAFWDAAAQLVVSGTDNQAPSWSGAPGSGWVSCDYTTSGVTLPAGHEFIAAVFTSDNVNPWFLADPAWFGAGGAFPSGITAGPVHYIGNSWHQGTSWAFPGTTTNPAEFDGQDFEVTPVASGPGLLMASGII